MKRGTQIVYVPQHADGPNHRDAEPGFVTTLGGDHAWCRYWSRDYPGALRTKMNSERTPIDALVVMDTVDQERVDEMLEMYY